MPYYKWYWDETTGTIPTNSWGTSWHYYETDGAGTVVRQVEVFANGQALKYDAEYDEDRYGGLAEAPITAADVEEFGLISIDGREFGQVWVSTSYDRYPEIVVTTDCLWGQPRLDGRRLAVGDIVCLVDRYQSLSETLADFELSLQQIKQALRYCRTLQCVQDLPLRFCHNCTLRVRQDDVSDGEEEDNWVRAERLYQQYFA
ncbi:DUF433 domain-containing protein [Hymenobacter cellulosilyticus]|uniref:DUF433 domain-containing protein n=1 Tax=Hymenobacter cellulosilyticus TaxID=2932248 RepID=A0A8T9Q6Z7_9BACT|nr:DUF433 domain-containing protein [Hymenobacter cellulosilyticus]UOQ71808.1 DUF433 domain-containing protein [Hymenobacter cellulosilyticus]